MDSQLNCAIFNNTYNIFVMSHMTSQRKMLKGVRLALDGFWPLTLLFKI